MIDLEKSINNETHHSLRLWLRLLSTSTLIENTIRVKMREEFNITLPRFDLMAQLERHENGLSMGELSQRLMVSGGNITSITDNLEKEKLVQRVNDIKDRRSIKIKLTQLGRETFNQIAAKHELWIVNLFQDFDEQKNLRDNLGQLKRSIQTHKENLK